MPTFSPYCLRAWSRHEEQTIQDKRPDETVLPGCAGQQIGGARAGVRNHQEADGHPCEGREDSGKATEAAELKGDVVVVSVGATQTRPKRGQVASGGTSQTRPGTHQEADQELDDRYCRVAATILRPPSDVVGHAGSGNLEDRVASNEGHEDREAQPHRAEA